MIRPFLSYSLLRVSEVVFGLLPLDIAFLHPIGGALSPVPFDWLPSSAEYGKQRDSHSRRSPGTKSFRGQLQVSEFNTHYPNP